MKNWHGKRYHSLNSFFQERFNGKVYRVALDAGFTCPNRDGTKGRGGCVYCNEAGSRASYVDPKKSVKDQLLEGIRLIRTRTGAGKYIAYFQAYTNTYHPDPEFLEKLYLETLSVPDVVGLSVGTRPDCVPDAVLDMLEKIAERHFVLLEFGAQSMKEETLGKINRRHRVSETSDAVKRAKKRAGIEVLAQLIFGLPDETPDDMKKSVRELTALGVNGFKFHHLYVEKNTMLEKMYYADKIKLLTLEEYLDILCGVLPLIPENVVLHRLFGQCSKDTLVAPHWTLDKNANLERFEKLLEERGIVQGSAVEKR